MAGQEEFVQTYLDYARALLGGYLTKEQRADWDHRLARLRERSDVEASE